MAHTYMATVYDYLDWRGDLDFAADPFQEVDNVLLSLISYVDLEGVMKEGQTFTLEEAVYRYFQLHTREEIMARDSFVKMTPFLMEKAAATKRFAGTVLHDYVNIIDADAGEQMAAVTFDLADGTSYVAFRGTDSTLVGWKEDFTFSYLSQTSGQKHAADYLTKVGNAWERPLRVGGHSKGGNLAVYASAFCEAQVKERIIEVFSNDGPGFQKEVADTKEMKEISARVHSIVPEESVFGLLLCANYEHSTVRSSALGILQHDAQSWQVLGNHFVRADGLKNASILLDKTLTGWINGIEPQQRRTFVEFLFDALKASGAETFDQLNQSRMKNYGEVLKAAWSMDKKRRDEFAGILSALARNGKNTMAEEMKKYFAEMKKPETGEEG